MNYQEFDGKSTPYNEHSIGDPNDPSSDSNLESLVYRYCVIR